MIGVQIVAVLFALIMSYFSFLHFKRREFGKTEFIFWMVLWIGFTVVVIYPAGLTVLLETFNIPRAFDLILIVGMVVVFGITFRNYVRVKRLERKIEEYTREESIKDIK